MTRVVGLDLSLTGTGIATSSFTIRFGTKPEQGDTVQRVGMICGEVMRVVGETPWPDLVVIEAPSFSSVGGQAHERGYLWWRVAEHLTELGIPYKRAAPSMLKKYACGSGGPATDKDAMLLAAARRFPWFGGKNDEADALWACALGYDFLGSPLVQMPAVNREALNTWINPPAPKKKRRKATV